MAMDGGSGGNPYHYGQAPPFNAAVSGINCRWGEGGGINYSVCNGSMTPTSNEAMQWASMQQQQPCHYQQQNYFINSNNYVTQHAQSSAMGWTPGGDNCATPYSSLIPLSSSIGSEAGPLPPPYHPYEHHSRSNNAMMTNFPPGYPASTAMANSQPISQHYFHNPATMSTSSAASYSSVYTCNASAALPHAYSQIASRPNASTPIQTPPPNSNPNNFYLKDELRRFYSQGQSQALDPFCNRDSARRVAMSREINKHNVLKNIRNRHVKGLGFSKADSDVALRYIDELQLPSRPTPPLLPSPPPFTQSSVDPYVLHSDEHLGDAINSAKATVQVLVNHHLSFEGRSIVGRKEDLLVNVNFVTAMQMLRSAGVYSVHCGRFTAVSCECSSCSEIMVNRSQENNQRRCKSCEYKKYHAPIAESNKEQNFEKRTDPSSKTPYEQLNPNEKKVRNQKKRNAKKSQSKRVQKLVDELAKEVPMTGNEEVRDGEGDTDGNQSSRGEAFKSDVKEMLHVLLQMKDRTELKEVVKTVLSQAMASLIADDTSNQAKTDIDLSEMDEMVDCVIENMENMSKSISGKGKQCRFSPSTLALATAVYNVSPSAYREMKANSTIHLPGERHLQRVRAETKVNDGQTTKPYLVVKGIMKGRGVHKFEGLLQCDEMKLLHGVAWNTQTGDAVGLADDMLDINSMIRRVFSDDGHTVEAAEYANQWQFVAITDDGVEYFLLEHFFNDGSLTGETLLNQLEHVVKMCEEVNMKVSGLCCDAGGNNSRLLSMLRQKKLKNGQSWLNEEDCSIKHTTDPSRRLYIWFCTTHILKALRGQFLSSHQSGKKAFQDSAGTNFGWAFVEYLYAEVQRLNKESGGSITNGVRLDAKAVNPNKSDKMSVTHAKRPFEWKTISFAISLIAKKLDIAPDKLKEATKDVIARHPNKRSESEDKAFSDLHHGYALEQVLYLQKVHNERRQNGGSNEETTESDSTNEVRDDNDDDDDLDDDDLDEEDDEHAYEELESDESGTKAKSVRSNTTQDKVASDDTALASDIASLLFMVHIQSLFHDLFMCKNEKITKDNCDIVENLVKRYLSYFEGWKKAQMKRERAKDPAWERSFLAHQTWKNMRHGLCGFIHFARYMVEKRGVKYVPMLLSNQSSLESRFSYQRRTNHASATTFSAGVSNMSQKSARAQTTNRCYLKEDCVEENEVSRNNVPNGYSLAKKQRQEIEDALNKVHATRKSIDDQQQRRNEPSWMLGSEQPTTQRPEMQGLAASLNQQINTSILDAIIGTKRFQQFHALCHDDEDTKVWIEKFVQGPSEAIEQLFEDIMPNLLSYLEAEIYGNQATPCFGMAVRNYFVSDTFHNKVVLSQLKLGGVVCRKGSIMVVDAMVEIFLNRVTSVISEMVQVEDDVADVTEESPDFFKQLQNIVGAGISKAKEKFCPLKDGEGPEYALLRALGLTEDHDLIDDKYRSKYYPEQYQIENQGKLALVHPLFISWSTKLLLFTIKLFSKKRMIRYRRDAIKVGKKELLAEKELFNDFIQAASQIINLETIDRCTLRKIYVRISVFAFHAYTGGKWDRTFNGVKMAADDTSNIALRTLLRTQGSTNGSTNTQKNKAQPKTSIAKLLGVEEKNKSVVSKKRKSSGDDQNGSSKSRRTTDADMKKAYHDLFPTVVSKLKQLGFDSNRICTSRLLNMEERCAFVFVHFKKFYKHKNSGKVSDKDIKQILKSEMDSNNAWSNSLRDNISEDNS